jgi:hypothetical protein
MTLIFIVIGLFSFNPAQVTFMEDLDASCKIQFNDIHNYIYIKDMKCAEVIKEIDRQIAERGK